MKSSNVFMKQTSIHFTIVFLLLLSDITFGQNASGYILSENDSLIRMEIATDSLVNHINLNENKYYTIIENRGQVSDLSIYTFENTTIKSMEFYDIRRNAWKKRESINLSLDSFNADKITGFYQIYKENPSSHSYFKIVSYYKVSNLISRIAFLGVGKDNNSLPSFDIIIPQLNLLKNLESKI